MSRVCNVQNPRADDDVWWFHGTFPSQCLWDGSRRDKANKKRRVWLMRHLCRLQKKWMRNRRARRSDNSITIWSRWDENPLSVAQARCILFLKWIYTLLCTAHWIVCVCLLSNWRRTRGPEFSPPLPWTIWFWHKEQTIYNLSVRALIFDGALQTDAAFICIVLDAAHFSFRTLHNLIDCLRPLLGQRKNPNENTGLLTRAVQFFPWRLHCLEAGVSHYFANGSEETKTLASSHLRRNVQNLKVFPPIAAPQAWIVP